MDPEQLAALAGSLDQNMVTGNLNDLGQGDQQVVGAGGTSGGSVQGDPSEALANILAKQRDQAAQAAKAIPKPETVGMGGSVLRSALAAVLTGATGAGVQASGPAADAAFQVSEAMREAKNAQSVEEYNQKVADAQQVLDGFSELQKGMRMQLQAQPGTLNPEMESLISEIAYGGVGMGLPNLLHLDKGNADSNKGIIGFGKELLKHVKDPTEQASIMRMMGHAYGVTDEQMGPVGSQAFVDPVIGGLSNDLIVKNAANSALLLNQKEKGVRIEWEDVQWNFTGTRSTNATQIDYTRQWAEKARALGVGMWEAFDSLPEEIQIPLQKWFGTMQTQGQFDPNLAFRAAQRAIAQVSKFATLEGGDLGSPDAVNELIKNSVENEMASINSARVARFNQQITSQARKLRSDNPSMSVTDARKAAAAAVRKEAKSQSGRPWFKLSKEEQDDIMAGKK